MLITLSWSLRNASTYQNITLQLIHWYDYYVIVKNNVEHINKKVNTLTTDKYIFGKNSRQIEVKIQERFSVKNYALSAVHESSVILWELFSNSVRCRQNALCLQTYKLHPLQLVRLTFPSRLGEAHLAFLYTLIPVVSPPLLFPFFFELVVIPHYFLHS